MSINTRCRLAVAVLALSLGACSSSNGDSPQVAEARLHGTTWTLQSVQGALAPVSGEWTFDVPLDESDGIYHWWFFAPGFFDVKGTGTYKLSGSTMTVTGVLTQVVGSEAFQVTITDESIRFRDDEQDEWLYTGKLSSPSFIGKQCTEVQQGQWEFELVSDDSPTQTFAGGDLVQDDWILSYGDDGLFHGILVDRDRWEVEVDPDFWFSGNFRGYPADTFEGTFTKDGVTGDIVGWYVED